MNPYAGRRILVAGGLGFLGSNLSIRLVQQGATVTIVDSAAAGTTGNLRNISPIAGRVCLIESGIRDAAQVRPALKGVDIVFNLASNWEADLGGTARHIGSQIDFLQECVRSSPGVRVVHAGTCQVYGKPEYLPVDESHPIAPLDLPSEQSHVVSLYHLLFAALGRLDSVVLRLSGVYGPRAGSQALRTAPARFLVNAVKGEPLEVPGPGTDLLDPLYVDDAVDALLLGGVCGRLRSRVYNAGGNEQLTTSEMANIVCRVAGIPAPVRRSQEHREDGTESRSFVADSALIGEELGWAPKTSFQDGVEKTLRFLCAHLCDEAEPLASLDSRAASRPAAGMKQVSCV